MNEYEELIKLRTTVDACCLRMGVNEPADLYVAVAEVDEAIKAFMYDHDDSKIRIWWNRREY